MSPFFLLLSHVNCIQHSISVPPRDTKSNPIQLKLAAHHPSNIHLFPAKLVSRSERRTTELGGKDWFVFHRYPAFNQTLIFQVTFDIANPTAVEKESPVQSQLPWFQHHINAATILLHYCNNTFLTLILQQYFHINATIIDVISGMPTAPSLTGLKWKRQRENTKRWTIIIFLLFCHNDIVVSRTSIAMPGDALGLQQHGNASLVEQTRHREPRPGGLHDHRLLCHNHAISKGGRKTIWLVADLKFASEISPRAWRQP